jgi:putative YhdH/YhfP family quinone oxidoreductase
MADTFRAFTGEKTDDGFRRGVVEMRTADLPSDGVLIEVQWSSVNFKDSLAASEKGRVARISPLVCGIDLAGVVRESDVDWLSPGDEVLAHGYDLGVSRHGGFGQLARVPADWIVPLPEGLSAREAMLVGTAGYTAGLSVLALLDHGLTPETGPVLVTGATGGVGSMAVSMLAGLGFTVAAGTGKPAAAGLLERLGASEIIARDDLTDVTKPLLPARWAGAVDSVGGVTLAHVLATLMPFAAVAASGNVGGVELPTSVLPFILRGVTLFGIDSSQTPIAQRRAVWQRIADDLKPRALDELEHVVTLDELGGALDEISRGGVTGRYVVDVQA